MLPHARLQRSRISLGESYSCHLRFLKQTKIGQSVTKGMGIRLKEKRRGEVGGEGENCLSILPPFPSSLRSDMINCDYGTHVPPKHLHSRLIPCLYWPFQWRDIKCFLLFILFRVCNFSAKNLVVLYLKASNSEGHLPTSTANQGNDSKLNIILA